MDTLDTCTDKISQPSPSVFLSLIPVKTTAAIPKVKEKIDVALILDAIQRHVDHTDLQRLLGKYSSNTVAAWKNEQRFDLLHYSILNNNMTAIILLLNKGCFKPPYIPLTWPYLHFVACFGYTSLISVIVQEIGYQNDALNLDWDMLNEFLTQNEKIKPDTPKIDAEKMWTPVDIAAIFEHISCVELFLDFWHVYNQRSSVSSVRVYNPNSSGLYLLLACKVNSPHALRLLMKIHTEKREALECALRMSSPECTDVVLRDLGPLEVKKAFQGMNLFHVLYSYSCCLTAKQYEAMVEITNVLIRHNQDVNSLRPSRTYPLYSLLSHTLTGISMEESAPYLIATALLLLEAGADPNVDEIMMEENLNDAEQCTAFGRQPYSSAINCILSNMPNLKMYDTDKSSCANPVDKFIHKSIELLLRHGADLSHKGKFISNSYDKFDSNPLFYTGTALHLMVSTKPINFINNSTLELLLRNGIDADTCGEWSVPEFGISILYALNILPFSIWTSSLSARQYQLRENLVFSEQDLTSFSYIMKFMSQGSITLAYKEFLFSIEKLKLFASEHNKTDILERFHLGENDTFLKIIQAFERASKEPWLLQHYCSQVIWKSCRQHVGNVYALSIPARLRDIILMFH